MKMIVLDEWVSNDLIARRKQLGIDKGDEVWDGVYVMSPLASNPHQDIVIALSAALYEVIIDPDLGRVHAGSNVSDRHADWEHNYRCPDVVVVLKDGVAIDRGTHWQGGPDFLVEVQSPGDDTLNKLPFYASIGVRELLVVDRDSREPTLYRLQRKKLTGVPPISVNGVTTVVSEVVPLSFRQITKKGQPLLEIRRTAGRRKTWTV